jgi:nicotinate-nucleotide pyrophosphorylase (carboxylating)
MSFITPPEPIHYEELIKRALNEDIQFGDITTDNLNLSESPVSAELIAKEDGIIAGLHICMHTFVILDRNRSIDFYKCNFKDGEAISKGDIIAKISLPPDMILKGERVALNLLTHLSGIATMTNRLVKLVGESKTKISDTRKTLPGMRLLQKYAVKVGGGMNHRFSLSDAAMIKNNHIALSGGIKNAVDQVRAKIGHTVKIEVETSDLNDVTEALKCEVDIIMLDNFTPEEARKAVELIDGKMIVELSGGIDESNIVEYSSIGANVISIGALTHSVKALDIALHIKD